MADDDIHELAVRLTPEGMDEVQSGLQDVDETFQQTADSAEEQAGRLQSVVGTIQSTFRGAFRGLTPSLPSFGRVSAGGGGGTTEFQERNLDLLGDIKDLLETQGLGQAQRGRQTAIFGTLGSLGTLATAGAFGAGILGALGLGAAVGAATPDDPGTGFQSDAAQQTGVVDPRTTIDRTTAGGLADTPRNRRNLGGFVFGPSGSEGDAQFVRPFERDRFGKHSANVGQGDPMQMDRFGGINVNVNNINVDRRSDAEIRQLVEQAADRITQDMDPQQIEDIIRRQLSDQGFVTRGPTGLLPGE